MSKPNMEDIIKTSLESASTSSTEVSIWVTELRDFHKEESRRWKLRQHNLDQLEAQFDAAATALHETHELLAQERQALARERTTFTKERTELQELKHDFSKERLYLAKTIEKLEPDPLTGFWVSLLAALFALGIFAIVQLLIPLVPGVVRWAGSLF